MNWLVIFIDAKQRHVQIVARVFKVVGIAAQKRNFKFGREYQTHVGVLFVAIDVVLPALIKGDHVATQSGGLGALFRDAVHGRIARGVSLPRAHAGFYTGVHAGGDVFDTHQHVELEVGRLHFFFTRRRIESNLVVIDLRGADL